MLFAISYIESTLGEDLLVVSISRRNNYSGLLMKKS